MSDTTAQSQAETPEPQTESDADTFDRGYVQDLRKESAGYRERAKTAEEQADQLGRQLFLAKVKATGRLADPTDLAYDPDALEDDAKIHAAIDTLLAAKPHFASRTPTGNIGQGVIEQGSQPFSLTSHLKALV
jgi:hypothetical protein